MWKTVKLGDTIEIARGGSPRPIKSFITTEDDGVNWIKIGDTEQGGRYIHTTKEKIKPSGVSRSRYVKENDFLLSNSMSFGRPYILKTSGCIHDGWLVLSEYQELFSADYLYYLLSSSLVQNQFERLARGSTVRNLNIELVSQVTVPLPPLAEQQRIVAKLDAAFVEIDTAIEVAEKMLSNAEAMRTKFVCQTFQTLDAVSTRLEDVTEILNGFAFKSGDFTTCAGTNVVKITNVGIREFIETDDTQLPTEFAENYSKVSVKEGDVVFALTRTIINSGLKVARIPEAYHGALLNQRVAAVTASRDSIDTDFLYLYLSSDIVKDYVIEHVNTLMQPNLSIADLRNLEIPVATLKEQRLTAQRIEEVSSKFTEIQDTAKRKIREYISLKSSILAQELQSEAA